MARQVVEEAVSVLIGDANVSAARRAVTTRDYVHEETVALDRRLFERETVDYRLARILDSIQRITEHGGTTAEWGIQAVVRRNDLTEERTNEF